MSAVVFQKVSKAFAGRPVLDEVSFELSPTGKVALVGRNGSGKSTILRLIAGRIRPDRGSVRLASTVRLGYLPQRPAPRSDLTAHERVLSARPRLAALRRRVRAFEERQRVEGEQDAESAAAYAEAVTEFAEADGYRVEQQAEQALRALGVGPALMGRPLGELSGGERTRAELARALLSDPTLLLLDEPTNHLDLDGVRWLEQTLLRYQGALVLVTHDRRLLERVTDSVMEVERGKVVHERGTFTDFMRRKRQRVQRQMQRYLEQQKRARSLREAINRAEGRARGTERRTIHFHYRKRAANVARRAVTLKRRLEREMDAPRARRPRAEAPKMRLDLAPRRWHAGCVLRMEGIAMSFGDRTLFEDVALELTRGERVALIGPNGSGKTTLMEVALGRQPAAAGDVWLSPGARPFYCDQHQAGLDPERTVLESVAAESDLDRSQVHYLLARLLFEGDAVHKRVGDLSGGERTRLLLALLMNTRADLLLLDEPTNHLDLASVEVLQEGLRNYAGAALLISHDRAFIRAVATRAFELRDGRLTRLHMDQIDAELNSRT